MDLLYKILLVLHLLSWAVLLGTTVASMAKGALAKGSLHAALTALVTGILMVGLKEMADGDVNHMKIGLKLLVTLVVAALVVIGERKPEKVTKGYLGAIAGGVVLNVALAVLWGSTHGA